jgi:transcriptional regulator with XRE-family HTH domain
LSIYIVELNLFIFKTCYKMTTMVDKLTTWLSKEMEQRGWSHRELARRAGVSQTAVSGTLSGERKAGCDFCIKIAYALGESPEKVLRLAGILPSPPASDDSTLAELHDLIQNLPPAQRKEALRYLKFLYQSGQDKE